LPLLFILAPFSPLITNSCTNFLNSPAHNLIPPNLCSFTPQYVSPFFVTYGHVYIKCTSDSVQLTTQCSYIESPIVTDFQRIISIVKLNINHVGSEVFTAVVMKSIIIWDMTPCSPLSHIPEDDTLQI
jgi:hypothetical protein